jgi:hypothetical protein
LSSAQLDDRTASVLADITQTLVVVEAAGSGPSEMLRDSTAIQRLVADRHGAFRARLGWHESELAREFVILREEIEFAIRRRATDLGSGAPVDDAAGLHGGEREREGAAVARYAGHVEVPAHAAREVTTDRET